MKDEIHVVNHRIWSINIIGSIFLYYLDEIITDCYDILIKYLNLGGGDIVLIGICDDEAIIRDDVIRMINIYKISNIDELEIVCYSSGEELLECNKSIDVLFLDIQMNGMDGLKTAEKIRENDEGMIIIFLTGYQGFMQEGYKVRAFRYLLKPIKDAEFVLALSEAIKDITKNYKVVIGPEGGVNYVKLRNIIYIECEGRYSVVRTKRAAIESKTTMSEWESILNTGDFYRVHKSYIVNMEYIEEIGKQILLDNGEKVALAMRQVGRLKKACKDYRKRNAR